ncbi:MAG: gliding motility-associated C-terminal domain-containing protein [Flavobacteriales bacterium]|nr:MAG: gliding motility-associated C-terminal domain-containing protein [Flavobacteriales bacterium]
MGAPRSRSLWRKAAVVLCCLFFGAGVAQPATYYFNSGPIPQCDTSVFTANVSGIGFIQPYGTPWGFSLTGLGINITTDHPQTLQITLTSPVGTDLLLSAFNGAGGQNYTGTVFNPGGWPPNITTGTAPFTGSWTPQGGNFDVFDFEWGDGTWTITVVDTACANGGTGPNGTWTPGWFDGNGQNGGFDISFFAPMCPGGIPWGTSTVCAGGTVDIMSYYQPSGYTISVMDPWFQPVADPYAVSVAGSYYVDAYDPWDGCWYSAFFEVNIIQPPALGPNVSTSLCTGAQAVDLTSFFALQGTTTDWTLNGTPISNATAAAAYAPGVYQLIASAGNGCSDTADVTLSVLPSPSLGPDQSADVCLGGTIDLTTFYTTAGLTTTWTFAGSVVPDPTAVDLDGLYQLVGVNSDGCGDTAVVALVVHYPPALGPDQTVNLCDGSSIDLTTLFNTAGTVSTWYQGGAAIAPPVNTTSAGSFTLAASDPFGCSDTADVVILVDPSPVLGPDQVHQICNGLAFDLNSAYSTVGLSTTWTFGGAPVADPTAAALPGNYQLVATNAAGCGDTAVVTLSNQAPFSLGPDASDDICQGGTSDLTAFFITTGYTTQWTLAGVPVADPAQVDAPGAYMLVAADPNACSDTAFVTVVTHANPVVGPDQATTICSGGQADLTALFNTNGYTVAWYSGGVAVAAPTNATSAGAYELVVADTFGCSDTAVAQLTVDPVPVLGPDLSQQACNGVPFDLTTAYSTTGLLAAWTLNGAAVADPSAVSLAGSYQLVATNSFGCTDTALVALAFNANPSAGPDQSFQLCPWQSVDLTALYALGGLAATYTVGGIPVSDPTAVADSGTYMVEVTDANGCTGTATVLVDTVHCLCEAHIVSEAHCVQDPAYFSVLADSVLIDVQWDFGGGAGNTQAFNPEVFYTSEGTAYVTLQATLSCGVVTVVDTIDLDDCTDSCGVFVPNAFTPDGDAVNDVWTMHSECLPEAYLIYIFNRWGELIHTGTDPRSPWDGTYNGDIVQDGVYPYRLVYRMPYQEDHRIFGHVTVLR